jgi:ureidoglycolate hydrolase
LRRAHRRRGAKWSNAMDDQPISLKLQPLTAEAFAPYGRMLDPRQPVFPEVEPGEGRVAIELLKLKRPSNPRRISMMATHFSYNQTFIPVRGTMALVVAPPPRNRGAGHENYDIDYDRVAAFFVEPGQAAFIDKGTWHYAVALGAECEFINVTRKNPGEGTSRIDDEMRMDKIPAMRPYVEVLDFRRRDKRVLELQA